MRTDMMPGAFDASFPADHSVEAAEVPTLPTQHVLPKALPVALSLIKLASTFDEAASPLVRHALPIVIAPRVSLMTHLGVLMMTLMGTRTF